MKAFVNLQQARHEADYNLLASFTRQGVLDHIKTVEEAFELFLSSLLLWDRWGKK